MQSIFPMLLVFRFVPEKNPLVHLALFHRLKHHLDFVKLRLFEIKGKIAFILNLLYLLNKIQERIDLNIKTKYKLYIYQVSS